MATDARLELVRKLIREEEERKSGNSSRQQSYGDNASYPIFKIPENATATVRFLPDKDETNPWFWVDRQVIRIPFGGTINGENGPTIDPVIVTVPCVDMFKLVCPVIAETKPWWKDERKPKAALYYKRVSFITQAFIVGSPIQEDNLPENPIRRVVIGKKLVDKLKAGMADAEMESLPTDFVNGTDFKLRKTKAGEYNDYTTSEYSRRTRPLNDMELVALDKFGLFNLADFRGSCPDSDGIAAIKAMFHSSLKGDPYDFSEFGTYYRPYKTGNAGPQDDSDDEIHSGAVANKVKNETKVEDSKSETSASPKLSMQEMMAKLKDRTASRS